MCFSLLYKLRFDNFSLNEDDDDANLQIANSQTVQLIDAASISSCFASVSILQHLGQINMKMQMSRPARKQKPTKALKALVIFNIFLQKLLVAASTI